MKTILYCLLFLIVLSCAPSKNNETAIDSTQNIVDTSSVSISPQNVTPTNYPPAPVTNFPSFSQDAITENELENSITQALTEMLNQYDTASYRKIKKEYTVYYKEASDYEGDSLDASESETKTWYFDMDNKLKAYTLEYAVKVGSSVYDPNSGSNIGESETSIYLFSNSSSEDPTLVAVYNDKGVYYDFATSSKKRAVTSKCPKCGVSLSYENEPTNDVEILEQDYISGQSTTFFDEYNSLLIWLKGREMKKDNENYVAKEELAHLKPGSDVFIDYTYTVDYTINESLYKKLVKGKTL